MERPSPRSREEGAEEERSGPKKSVCKWPTNALATENLSPKSQQSVLFQMNFINMQNSAYAETTTQALQDCLDSQRRSEAPTYELQELIPGDNNEMTAVG